VRWLLVLFGVLLGGLPATATVLNVGPVGYPFTTLSAAVSAASAGDTILLHGGPAGYAYTDQVATINKALTITGVDDGNGYPIFTQTPGTELPRYKGYLIVQADTTVSNITFQNAAISEANGGNAAGIRHEAGNLTVLNSQFINNQDGILSTPSPNGVYNLYVNNSVFTGNGSGTGQTHALYANRLAELRVTNSIFTGTNIGHDIKSRAANSVITGNFLGDGDTGTTSYAIDLSNGGDATISGNTIVQGEDTDNWTMISYGSEGLIWPSNNASITGNTFRNSNPGDQTTGIMNFASSGTNLYVANNSFCGLVYDVQGPATLSGNTSSPGPCSIPVPPLNLAWLFALLLLGFVRRPSLPA